MSTLVTGGTGYIGRYVVDRLRDRGEPVVSYDRAPATTGLPGGVVSVQGELFDLGRLTATISGHDVRQIVHAAGTADSLLSVAMPTATVNANAVGTLHVLEAGRLTAFDGRIVLLSSASVYGDCQGTDQDHRPLRPQTAYAAAKAFGDLLGQVYTLSYGLDVVSLRLSEAYGPGRKVPGMVEKIIEAGLARRPLRVAGGAELPCHLVHVEDATRAIVAALDAKSPVERVYDITGEHVRLGQIVAIVRDRLPHALIEVEPGDVPGLAPRAPIVSTAADRELGYRPRWGLARGIDDLCTWLEAEKAC